MLTRGQAGMEHPVLITASAARALVSMPVPLSTGRLHAWHGWELAACLRATDCGAGSFAWRVAG